MKHNANNDIPLTSDAPPRDEAIAAARRLPPLTALSYFEVAARTGSFAAAAKILHVTPAAISHQIKALESQLGVALFHRHHRHVSLTPAAQAALPRLQKGFAALADAVDRLRAAGEAQDVITICAEPLFATKWLVPRLHGFYAVEPEAELRLQASVSSVDSAPGGPISPSTYRRTGVDLSVRLGYCQYPDLSSDPLMPLRLSPVCTPKIASQIRVSADVLRQPWLADRTLHRCGLTTGWDEWLRLAGVEDGWRPREQVFGNGLLALEAALAGQGVLLADPSLLQAEFEAGKLVQPFPLSLDTPLGYCAVAPQASLQRPAVAAFRRWLLAEMSGQRASGR